MITPSLDIFVSHLEQIWMQMIFTYMESAVDFGVFIKRLSAGAVLLGDLKLAFEFRILKLSLGFFTLKLFIFLFTIVLYDDFFSRLFHV